MSRSYVMRKVISGPVSGSEKKYRIRILHPQKDPMLCVKLAKYSVSGLLLGLSTRVHLNYHNEIPNPFSVGKVVFDLLLGANAGSGSVFSKPDPRIRIQKKMDRIRNTDFKHGIPFYIIFILCLQWHQNQFSPMLCYYKLFSWCVPLFINNNIVQILWTFYEQRSYIYVYPPECI